MLASVMQKIYARIVITVNCRSFIWSFIYANGCIASPDSCVFNHFTTGNYLCHVRQAALLTSFGQFHLNLQLRCMPKDPVLPNLAIPMFFARPHLTSGCRHFCAIAAKGWVTAEYGMLPRSTHSRMDREASRGKQSGRTLEIQRLIGRSLRAVTDLQALGERQIKIDCDVIQADGGTRTAAITGAWVALRIACEKLLLAGAITKSPLTGQVAAISCGVFQGVSVLDLDYDEDSAAEIDANFVMTADDQLVEVQATGEATHSRVQHLTRCLILPVPAAVKYFSYSNKPSATRNKRKTRIIQHSESHTA
jgi:ribonuclease PH